MFVQIKTAPLLILGVTSILCSRLLFWLFDDPEGPNLLIVLAMAAFMYLFVLLPYVLNFPVSKQWQFVWAVAIQVTLIIVIYFLLN